MPISKDDNRSYTTLQQKLESVCPPYIARYVRWYMSPPDDRCSWAELCATDAHYRDSGGNDRTEEFCRENWLTREDAQKAVKICMTHLKTYNSMRIYQKMLDKALKGDVNAAKYIDNFHNSSFFEETTDEIDEFLNTVNIPKLKKSREAQGK